MRKKRPRRRVSFHQMPSGCVHGAKCVYNHSKAPPPNPNGEGSADPKPKPKTAPAAAAKTLATVAILAAAMPQPSQAGQIECAADSGAGRHLTSFEALSDQGYDHSFFGGFSNQSEKNTSTHITPFGIVIYSFTLRRTTFLETVVETSFKISGQQ